MVDSAVAQRRQPFSVATVFQDSGLRVALTYFVCAQLLDSLTTIAGLLGGLNELNPVTAGVIHGFGAWGLLLAKLPVVIAVLLSVAILPRRMAIAAAWTCAGLMSMVVVSNAALIVSLHP